MCLLLPIPKLVYSKYYKHWLYILAFYTIDCVCFSLLWSRIIQFIAKLESFFTCKLINFLVQTLQFTEQKLYCCICFTHKNMKKKSKVGYFSKIAEIFSNALTVQLLAQKQQKYMIDLSIYGTWNI